MTSKKPAALKLGPFVVLLWAIFAAWDSSSLRAAEPGSRAEYVGGTIIQIPPGCDGKVQTIDSQFFVFYSRKASWRVPYDKINLVEYGEKVDRRYIAAVLISPLFLLAKKRQHFLTVGYADEDEHQQAMIFKINKNDIRAILVSLEARTGRKVEYQDDDARKSGKG
ncbi:MAG: hypothetical protein JOZ32_11730 [Bryobacterales bacterium]|nr:hypothetical protein [Bryobacterales bacterium]